MRLSAALLACALALPAMAVAQQSTPPDTADPNLFLEEMTGARAMAWVKQENAKTVAVLEKDPRYASIFKAAVAMASAKDRIPYVQFIGGQLYNFWRDEQHVRGIWRRHRAKRVRGGLLRRATRRRGGRREQQRSRHRDRQAFCDDRREDQPNGHQKTWDCAR